MTDAMLEQAADDLLLLIDTAAADLPSDAAEVIGVRLGAVVGPAVSAWIAKHPTQKKGAAAATDIVGREAAEFCGAYYRLALRLVLRMADRAGMTPVEVVAIALPDLEEV